jgi:hypothetical protein
MISTTYLFERTVKHGIDHRRRRLLVQCGEEEVRRDRFDAVVRKERKEGIKSE